MPVKMVFGLGMEYKNVLDYKTEKYKFDKYIRNDQHLDWFTNNSKKDDSTVIIYLD